MWFERPGRSETVRTVWCATVETAGVYPIAGSEYWGISFVRSVDGTLSAELDGPSLSVRTVRSVVGESYWGVELAPFVVLAGFGKSPSLGETVRLAVQAGHIDLGGRSVPVPSFDDLERWIDRLVAEGLLVIDESIRVALSGQRAGASPRTWQRRFRQTVGLTAAQVEQIHRAERAYALLHDGVSPSEAAFLSGFADQSHLTRSMRLIRGRTPAAILSDARSRSASD